MDWIYTQIEGITKYLYDPDPNIVGIRIRILYGFGSGYCRDSGPDIVGILTRMLQGSESGYYRDPDPVIVGIRLRILQGSGSGYCIDPDPDIVGIRIRILQGSGSGYCENPDPDIVGIRIRICTTTLNAFFFILLTLRTQKTDLRKIYVSQSLKLQVIYQSKYTEQCLHFYCNFLLCSCSHSSVHNICNVIGLSHKYSCKSQLTKFVLLRARNKEDRHHTLKVYVERGEHYAFCSRNIHRC